MKNYENLNITIFGDSVSKGVFIENGNVKNLEITAVDIIERQLNIKIENNSVFGQTLSRVCARGLIDRYIENINHQKKNIVVLCLGGNDSDFNWKEVAEQPEICHQSKTPLSKFETLLEEKIVQLQKNKIEVMVCSLAPIISQRYFDNVITLHNKKEEILKFLKDDVSNIERNQQVFNIALLKIANKNNCKFIDFRTELLQQVNLADFMCEDGAHMNEKGQKFIANFIMKMF